LFARLPELPVNMTQRSLEWRELLIVAAEYPVGTCLAGIRGSLITKPGILLILFHLIAISFPTKSISAMRVGL
jgi:hypothetical protein